MTERFDDIFEGDAPFARGPRPEPDGRIPDDLVDAFFDGELEPGESADFFRALARDAVKADEVRRTRRALDALSKPVATPDLTDAILAQVDRKRGLLGRRGVRRLYAARVAAALALAAGAGIVFTAQRVAPEATRLAPREAPISDLADAMPQETSDALGRAVGEVRQVREQFGSIRLEAAANRAPRVAVAQHGPPAPETLDEAPGVAETARTAYSGLAGRSAWAAYAQPDEATPSFFDPSAPLFPDAFGWSAPERPAFSAPIPLAMPGTLESRLSLPNAGGLFDAGVADVIGLDGIDVPRRR